MVLILLPIPVAQAQPLETFAYQGYLLTNDGTPVNGTVDLSFTLYDTDTGGAALWQEEQADVSVAKGVFSVRLGSQLPFRDIAFDGPLWLGVAVDGGAELTPRMALGSVPYAMSVRGLRIVPGGGLQNSPSLIGGHPNNRLAENVEGAVIGGGGGPESESANRILSEGYFAVIGGGVGNRAGDSYATIGGGAVNEASNDYATIGGGEENKALGVNSTVGGGLGNTVGTFGKAATVGGGSGNRAEAEQTTVAGGAGNTAFGNLASVGGGENNRAGASATVAGGQSNKAIAPWATIAGGGNNEANGLFSTVPGGQLNKADGGRSFAAGSQAHASHDGAFVWADYADAGDIPFASTAPRQFLIRAGGGVGIGTNTPQGALHSQALDDDIPDLVLGGSNDNPNGIIASDPTLPESGLFLLSNRNVGILLDRNDDQDDQDGANFLIANGDQDLILILRENGLMTVGDLEATRTVTADSFRANDALGENDTPEEGGVYRDNVVYAWAHVNADGSVAANFGCTVTKLGIGRYRIDFERALRNGMAPVVTPLSANDPVLAVVSPSGDDGANVVVFGFANLTFLASDRPFFIQVVGRP